MSLKGFAVIILYFMIIGCSLKIEATIHDENDAAELTKEFFEQIKTHEGIKVAYASFHEKMQDGTTYKEFANGIEGFSNLLTKNKISIIGYETIGTEEVIMVYATMSKNDKKLFFRTTFLGTKSKGYKILNFNGNDKGYSHKGIYKKYALPLIVI